MYIHHSGGVMTITHNLNCTDTGVLYLQSCTKPLFRSSTLGRLAGQPMLGSRITWTVQRTQLQVLQLVRISSQLAIPKLTWKWFHSRKCLETQLSGNREKGSSLTYTT